MLAEHVGLPLRAARRGLHGRRRDAGRAAVLELGRVYGGTPPIVIPLIQEELAALAGTSRATVNRVLREAEGRGLVEVGRGRTVLLDPDGLARLARVRGLTDVSPASRAALGMRAPSERGLEPRRRRAAFASQHEDQAENDAEEQVPPRRLRERPPRAVKHRQLGCAAGRMEAVGQPGEGKRDHVLRQRERRQRPRTTLPPSHSWSAQKTTPAAAPFATCMREPDRPPVSALSSRTGRAVRRPSRGTGRRVGRAAPAAPRWRPPLRRRGLRGARRSSGGHGAHVGCTAERVVRCRRRVRSRNSDTLGSVGVMHARGRLDPARGRAAPAARRGTGRGVVAEPPWAGDERRPRRRRSGAGVRGRRGEAPPAPLRGRHRRPQPPSA